MDLQDARRILAQLGTDLDEWLQTGWQSMETGPRRALEQDLVKMPPQRTEFPDEDSLARYLVHQQLWVSGPEMPAEPAPARPWSVVRERPGNGPGLRWSARLVTASTCTAPDPAVLLVRDTSSWWDHLTAGAAVIRAVDLATGELAARPDNDPFALGTAPAPKLGVVVRQGTSGGASSRCRQPARVWSTGAVSSTCRRFFYGYRIPVPVVGVSAA